MKDLIPDREREAEVHVLWSVQLMVDAVIIRTHKDLSQRPETQTGIGVSESHDPAVDDENGDRQRSVGQKYHTWHQRQEVGDMDQRMGAKHRQHAHVLLRMVQLVKAPEHPDAVIGKMDEPVATVHGNDDHRDRSPARNRADLWQDDPRELPANYRHEGESKRSHEWRDECGVHDGEKEIMTISAGEEWSLLRRPYSFNDEEDPDDREGQRTHQDHTKTRQGSGEAFTSPVVGPTDHDQNGGQSCNTGRREVDPCRQSDPGPGRVPDPSLHWRGIRDPRWCN